MTKPFLDAYTLHGLFFFFSIVFVRMVYKQAFEQGCDVSRGNACSGYGIHIDACKLGTVAFPCVEFAFGCVDKLLDEMLVHIFLGEIMLVVIRVAVSVQPLVIAKTDRADGRQIG